MKSERQHREEIVRFGRMLHERGFVAASDGNLSVRLDHDTVLSTPTGMSKGMMEPEDLVVVDLSGKKVLGRRNVSSEIGMHLLIYRLRPDVKGIVHAHPPTATGYAACGLPLNQALISEIVLALGARETGIRKKSTVPVLSMKGMDTRFKLFMLVLVLFTLGNSSDAFIILLGQNRGLDVVQLLSLIHI